MNGMIIRGVGKAVPSKIVTNADFAARLDTSGEWISSRTGILRRHYCGEGETISGLIAASARRALEAAGVEPGQIGACIVATATAETIVPSAACALQRDLGLPEDIPCFDLNAACTGFLFALHTMECLLNAAPRKYGLVIGAENLSRVLDQTDRSTCILFGDGAGAAVVESGAEYPSISAVMGCHGSGELLCLPGVETGGHNYLTMEGTKVFKFAVEAVPWCVEQVLERTGKTVEDIGFFVFHQANARIIDLAARKFRIPPEKYYKNISEYGNTSAASIPLVLSELSEQGRIGPGSLVLAVGFGGGLTWGGALLTFAQRREEK